MDSQNRSTGFELKESRLAQSTDNKKFQPCPQCGESIGIVPGSKEAVCKSCGFKDPCCE